MAAPESAGLMMFRRTEGGVEVLLAHPGGPFWASRDRGAWTIPKGGVQPGESHLETAIREFREETGFQPSGPYVPLGEITQRGGKCVHAWAFEGDCDPKMLVSMTATVEWPPRSRKFMTVPEIDAVRFFPPDLARGAINQAQVPFIDRLISRLAGVPLDQPT